MDWFLYDNGPRHERVNLDSRKEPMEVYFSRRLNHNSPLPLDFKDNTVQTVEIDEHLGISLVKIFNIFKIFKKYI